MLRAAAIAYGILHILVGIVLLVKVHVAVDIVGYLILSGLIITGALLYENGRYRPKLLSSFGRWQVTDERFIDPATGKHMRVRYNPDTGEQDYEESGGE
jgi:hypothetical protein